MDAWQKTAIQTNLPRLIELTDCSPEFLSIFQRNSIIGGADLDHLGSLRRKLDQAHEFYKILVTRTRSFESLIEAAFECQLTGVLTILVPAFDSHYGSIGFLSACGIKLDLSEILKKPVVFQGSTCTLQECFGTTQREDMQELLESTLTASEFLKLCSSDANNKFVLVKNTIPDTVPYYIKRTLSIQNRIDPIVFQKNDLELDDIFVFKNVEWNQLSLLVAPNRTQRSTNQLQRLSVRFILLERNEDFDTICQLREHKSIHLIDHNDEKYFLLKTEGNFKKIEKYILPDESVVTEIEFVQKCITGGDKVICLSDTPGMGKSILLGNIAKALTSGGNTLSIFVVLSEIAKCLNDLKVNKEISGQVIVEKIASFASENALGRKLIGLMLNSEKVKVNLFFDGFDEILTSQKESVKKFLKSCAEIQNTTLFVTTRPHMRHELENIFGVQSLKIQPFTQTDQINFLQTYWCNKNFTESCPRLKNLAQSCLSNLQQNMKKTERNIAGIPLQCALLAEVYMKEAKLCCDANLDFHFNILPETNSVVGMYKNLVKLRFDERAGAEPHENLMYSHAHYALDLIFPYWSDNLASLFMATNSDSTDSGQNIMKLYNIGILEEGTGHAPKFVHRTMAEYFIAKLIIKILNSQISIDTWTLGQFKSFLWRAVFTPQHDEKAGTYIFQNSTICYFLNEKLSKSKFLISSENIHLSSATKDIKQEIIAQILLCCVTHDLGNIFKFVKFCFKEIESNCSETNSYIVSKYGNLMLLRGAKYASADLFQELHCFVRTLKGFEESTKTNSNALLTIAVKRGSYPIVEFLLATNSDTDSLYGQRLLHRCVIDSSSEEIGVVNEKKEIIKLLVKKQSRLLNEKNSFGYTPLLRHKIHLKLIECLIEMGADLRGGGRIGSTIAHRAASYMTPEEYHGLVSFLIKLNRGTLMNIQGAVGRTALHEALICLDLEERTFELISTIPGVNFDEKDARGNNILYCAVGSGKNVKILNFIIKHGGNWKAKNHFKSRMLHIAAKVGNLAAIRLFISLGANVNAKNSNKRTPLHLALRWGRNCVHEMVKIFIENGARINSVDVFGRTPLGIALNSRNSRWIESRTIALLKQAGAKEFPPFYFWLIPCIHKYRYQSELHISNHD